MVSHQQQYPQNIYRKSYKPPEDQQSSNGRGTDCTWGSLPLLPSGNSWSGRGSGTS